MNDFTGMAVSPRGRANRRYDAWLIELHDAGKAFGLIYREDLVGFVAVEDGKLLLHTVASTMQGRGYAKYLWTPVCQRLFSLGWPELTSSISAANTAVVNLYASLGFRFRRPLDIYHRLTP